MDLITNIVRLVCSSSSDHKQIPGFNPLSLGSCEGRLADI